MPRSSALFTPRPVSGDDLVAAAQAVWSSTGDPDAGPLEWRSFDDGAVLQALAGDDVLVSILRPRVLPRPDEVARLWPDADVSGLPMPRLLDGGRHAVERREAASASRSWMRSSPPSAAPGARRPRWTTSTRKGSRAGSRCPQAWRAEASGP